jgi:hypothetical protein
VEDFRKAFEFLASKHRQLQGEYLSVCGEKVEKEVLRRK